jgi:hypothetical protein
MQVEHLENPHKYTVYHLPRRRQGEMRRASFIGFAVLAVLLAIASLVLPEPQNGFSAISGFLLQSLFYTPFILPNAIYQWLSASSTRLVISEQAIEYHTVGYSIIASTGSVVGLKTRRSRSESIEYLVLKSSQFEGSAFWLWFSGQRDYGDTIPIGSFYGWREGEMGAALAHLAPHLFQPKAISPGLPASTYIQSGVDVSRVVSALFAKPVAGKSSAKPRPKPVVRRP